MKLLLRLVRRRGTSRPCGRDAFEALAAALAEFVGREVWDDGNHRKQRLRVS